MPSAGAVGLPLNGDTASALSLQGIQTIEIDAAGAKGSFRLSGAVAIAARSGRHSQRLGPLTKNARARVPGRRPIDFDGAHAKTI